jgi:hypothetical protein
MFNVCADVKPFAFYLSPKTLIFAPHLTLFAAVSMVYGNI